MPGAANGRLNNGTNPPSAPMLRAVIGPLVVFTAYNSLPLGVMAIKRAPSISVAVSKGEPGTGVMTPVLGLIEKALILPPLLTYRKFLSGDITIPRPELPGLPPVMKGELGIPDKAPMAPTEKPDTEVPPLMYTKLLWA